MESIKKYSDLFPDLTPDQTYYHINRGHGYFKKRELDNAISSYTRAIEMDPSYFLVYYDRAMAYYLKGDLVSALVDYQMSKILDSNGLQEYLNIDDFYNDIGKLEDILAGYIKHPQVSSTHDLEG